MMKWSSVETMNAVCECPHFMIDAQIKLSYEIIKTYHRVYL